MISLLEDVTKCKDCERAILTRCICEFVVEEPVPELPKDGDILSLETLSEYTSWCALCGEVTFWQRMRERKATAYGSTSTVYTECKKCGKGVR